jgi:hypothetical protein
MFYLSKMFGAQMNIASGCFVHVPTIMCHSKRSKLSVAKAALQNRKHLPLTKAERKAYAKLKLFGLPKNTCPCCKKGQLVTIDIWLANKDPPDYLKAGERK